ncbi:GTP pyrophosphokinase [Lactococcus kimchii]|uniref:GTP pyrophosphokinase n=1 Tax=Lactococcus sp. S-13 TaxID=2507158 RepID=UPI0010230CAB|nr:GTP pyrophosphokinase family protein [Lactococcus sp. S-13]RZI48485.1 GTP pyrophosphokinase family protein [Lactococcus sp. S-13]
MEKDYLKTRFAPEEFEELKKRLVKYECALDVVYTQFSNLNTYYNNFEAVNPIEHIKHRLKSPESIAGKLKKKGLPITAEQADEHLSDIAGIRVICSYAKNIYEIVEIIKNQEAFTVVSQKDYLKDAKKTGYRSYHMILEVNLGHLFGEQSCRVEVQLRTSAMDFWASLEHKVRYKYDGKIPQQLSNELQNCAEQIHALDERMYLIHKVVDMINQSEVDIDQIGY